MTPVENPVHRMLGICEQLAICSPVDNLFYFHPQILSLVTKKQICLTSN